MNILFLSKDYPPEGKGGVATYNYEMAGLLSELGYNVFVIEHSRENRSYEYMDKRGVHVFSVCTVQDGVQSPLLERVRYSYAASRKLREINSRYGIDIVEGREAMGEAFWYFFFHPRGKRPYLVVKLHTPESIIYQMNQFGINLDIRMVQALEEWWIRRADRIIGLTKAIVKLTSNFFELNLNGVPIVPNPIDIKYFTPSEQEASDDGLSVLYTGRLEFRKGVHVLMRAIPGVLNRFPTAKFIFIGADCGMKTTLQRLAKDYGCEQNLDFVEEKQRGELRACYQQATLCVIPSLWENHPYTCLEAMACGKPIVASRTGGIPEIIEHNVSGILVPAGSTRELSKAIVELLEDKKQRKLLGENARKKMEDTYSPQSVAEKSLKIYKELLKEGGN